jgi:protein-tyrosine kinase
MIVGCISALSLRDRMENIRQAVERAKEFLEQHDGIAVSLPRPRVTHGIDDGHAGDETIREIELDSAHLQSKRMIAYDGKDLRSRSFDILRNQVSRSMEQKGWKILAVTSPTPSCGKTLTAINLALSLARQPEQQVLLVDMDLRKPQVADCLGLMGDEGLLGVIEGHTTLTGAIIRARIGSCKFEVLPTAPSLQSSDLIGSHAMTALLHEIGKQKRSRIVIVDLPPLLSGDDAMAILPQVDCVLFVAAVGISTVSEIEECNKHLESTDVVRFVLNKAPESKVSYQYY